MARFITLRFSMAILQILLVATLVFGLLHLLPGDPVLVVLGSERTPDPQVVAAVRARLGLDKPLHVQYIVWLRNLSKLDLGKSLVDDKPVWNEISARLPRSLELIIAAILLSILFGITLGIVAALNRNNMFDWMSTTLSSFGVSVPVYVIGTLLVLIFGVELKLLPIAGYIAPAEDINEHLRRLILPAVALSLSPTAIIARMTRSSMLDVLIQNYIVTARGKGVKPSKIILIHALRPALIPIVTVIGLQFGSLLGGSVLVEYIFNWPGLSTLLVTAIGRRDYPTVQAVIMTIATFFVFINLAVDLTYGFLDPRIRQS